MWVQEIKTRHSGSRLGCGNIDTCPNFDDNTMRLIIMLAYSNSNKYYYNEKIY